LSVLKITNILATCNLSYILQMDNYISKTKSCALIILLILFAKGGFSKTDPVKGVWITNVASNALDSPENIREAVRVCEESGINNIFVVTWNRARTLYPSAIMKEKFGIPIMERFNGRDPLKEMITEAHAHNIKVHAWFEFGFSSSYNENGGMILAKFPEWAAINSEGNLVSKNGFEWMNPFNPDVQNFINSLIKEVVTNYQVDGIQGDDRLPAVPSEAGYDKYTVSLYQSQHKGQSPPADYTDKDWVNWRADLLTQYLGNLYKDLKKLRPRLIVSMAPSIYPWGKEKYLQDWPAWVAKGYVDYVLPQVYRYNFKAYSTTLLDQAKELKESDKGKVFPGVLLQVNGKNPSAGFLDSMIVENRRIGFKGECFFFFEGLKKFPEFFHNYKNQ
jgi:uncharacterized lipoprotein YddW (UPF0748 family)